MLLFTKDLVEIGMAAVGLAAVVVVIWSRLKGTIIMGYVLSRLGSHEDGATPT
jgi:hypothetical protein